MTVCSDCTSSSAMSDSVIKPSATQMRQRCEPVERQGKEQDHIIQVLQHLSLRLDHISAAVTHPPVIQPAPPVISPPATVPVPRLHLPTPAKFSRDPKACRGFINQCSIQFELFPGDFPTPRTKVAYIISRLSDQAMACASPFWERQDHVI